MDHQLQVIMITFFMSLFMQNWNKEVKNKKHEIFVVSSFIIIFFLSPIFDLYKAKLIYGLLCISALFANYIFTKRLFPVIIYMVGTLILLIFKTYLFTKLFLVIYIMVFALCLFLWKILILDKSRKIV